jgi:hypothetical protein
MTNACWLPPELQSEIDNASITSTLVRRYWRDEQWIDVTFQRFTPEALRRVAAYLHESWQRVLRTRPIDSIARILDRAAERWLDSEYQPRQQAIHEISIVNGMSNAMVAHSIDLEQKSSRYRHLTAALQNELGNPAYLDGFVENPNLGGFSFARGPQLLGFICSSNIPALPHLELMRAFLVKSACLARVSSREPIFLSLYARTLAMLDPALASCLAVVYWEHDDQETENTFLSLVDHLVAYGGESQIRRLQGAKPPVLESTWHGHRIGFIYLCREALNRSSLGALAERVSYDYTLFDGQACLMPQVCFVETGGEASPLEFGRACASAMAEWAVKLPPRHLGLAEASGRYRLREICLMREAMEETFQVVAAPEDYSYTVVLEKLDKLEPSNLERFVRIVPVNDLGDVEEYLRPFRPYLQCAALATGTASGERIGAARRRLASWGVTRIVPPGLMGTPSMMWHHDGMPCLGRMVEWCDEELVLPEAVRFSNVDKKRGDKPGAESGD